MKCPRCGADVTEGMKFCTSCGGKIDEFSARVVAPRTAAPLVSVAPVFDRDKFLFNQKKFSLREMYYVFDEQGQELFFIRRLLLALRRHIHIYTDRTQKNEVLTVLQDRIFMIFSQTYTLIDMEKNVIARFRRRNIISILRRTRDILSADGQVVGRAVEDSWGKALFRRFGPLGELFKTDFFIFMGDRLVGKFIRKLTLFDKYILDLTADSEGALDHRVALALGVLLDTAERR